MRIGIIGTGNIGKTLARKLSAGGHAVLVANSRGPETIEPETLVTLQPAAVAAPGRGGSLPDSREVRTAFRTAETGLWPRCLSVRKTLISTAWVSAPVSLPLA